MNLNNWLCKHFDNDKKGYTVIGDIIFSSDFILFILITVLAWQLGTTFEINGTNPEIPFLISMLIGYFVIIIGFSIIFIPSYIIFKVLKIKIAKCQLKEEKEL